MASTFILTAAAVAMSANAAMAQAQGDSPVATSQNATPVPQVPGTANTIGSPAAVGATTDGTAVQEVTVTGSRIPTPNLTSNSPITTVSSQEFKLEGTTNVETLLNQLPQFTANQNNTEVNGASGTANINLRNIGPQRTLVLVNGRRLMPGDPGDPYADINAIPAALVDRVDVVTGGASSIYGADAVAGVVNFILKHNFQGVQIDAQAGFANHSNGHDNVANSTLTAAGDAIPGNVTADGPTWDASLILGVNSPDDKGNITAYATFHNSQPVLQSTRSYSYCGSETTGTNFVCAGSSNTNYGLFDLSSASLSTTNLAGQNAVAATLSNPTGGRQINNPNGTQTFIPYSGAYSYNFNPLNFIQREDNRYTGGFEAHYEINPHAEVYSDFMFLDDRTNAQIAPSGLFQSSGANLTSGYTINCNNPLISAAQIAVLCPGVAVTPGAAGGTYVNNVSIGDRFASQPRNDALEHTEYKFDVGMRGEIAPGWSYDGYLQYGSATLSDLTTGYASESKVQNALNVIDVNGVPTCVSGGACVPANIFSSKGLSTAALNYVSVDALRTGETQEQVASCNITGDLSKYGLKSPYADSGVGVVFGTEYRREQLDENYDTEQQEGDLSGGSGQTLNVAGSYDVYELFTEVRVPLVSNQPFIKDLSFDTSYRRSDYSDVGTTNTYGITGNYAPTNDFRFRGSFSRAVRAPNVDELFSPTVTGLGSFQDPCAGGAGVASLTLAQCEKTGVTAAQYANGITPCPSSQCSIQTGGNQNLKPETAITFSVGGVFTPTFVRNFSLSLDYFHIKVKNVISAGAAAPSTIISECANGVDYFCGLIHRDPTSGTLSGNNGYVVQGETNAGFIDTDGVDIAASYRFRLQDVHFWDVGSIALNLDGTYTLHNTTEPAPGLGTYNCVGHFGTECGQPQPNFKSEFRVSWITPWQAVLSLNYRYIGSSTLDYDSANPLLSGGAGFTDLPDTKIEAYSYLDFAFTYKIQDRYTIRGGINNLFDKDPPYVDANGYAISGPTNFGNGNTFPGIYDALGRTIFLGVTADF